MPKSIFCGRCISVLYFLQKMYTVQLYCYTAFFRCPMMRDELLPNRSPDKNQRLVMINGIYHVKYSVRNSLLSLPDDERRASPKT